MFDGLDEISPLYESIVIDLLDALIKTSNVKIWVTTRPIMKIVLEKKIDLISYLLEPFSEENQKDFLKKFWIKKFGSDNLKRKRINFFVKALMGDSLFKDRFQSNSNDDAGNPLQMKMLAEYFQTNLTTEDEWEGCEQFVLHDNSDPKFPKNLDFNNLFGKVIDRKFEIYANEKGSNTDGKITDDDAYHCYLIHCLKYHELLAFEELFSKEDIEWLTQSRSDNSTRNIEKFGLVEKIDGTFYFVHRSYAEYLVANFLAKMITTENGRLNTKTIEFIFLNILLPKDTTNDIAHFFNGALMKVINPVIDLSHSKEVIKTFEKWEKYGSSSALHLHAFQKGF